MNDEDRDEVDEDRKDPGTSTTSRNLKHGPNIDPARNKQGEPQTVPEFHDNLFMKPKFETQRTQLERLRKDLDMRQRRLQLAELELENKFPADIIKPNHPEETPLAIDSKISRLEGRISELETEIQTKDNELNQLRDLVESSRVSIKQQQAELTNREKNLNAIDAKLKRDLVALMKDRETHNMEIEEFSNRKETIKADLFTREQTLAKKVLFWSNEEARLTKLRIELSDKEARLRSTQAELEIVHRHFDGQNKSLETQRLQLKKREEMARQLEYQLKEREDKVRSKEEHICATLRSLRETERRLQRIAEDVEKDGATQ